MTSNPVKVVVHYGPTERPAVDADELFTEAAAALTSTTPALTFVDSSDAKARPLQRLPMVYIPPSVLGHYLVGAERQRVLAEGRGAPGVLSAARAVAAARETALARAAQLPDHTHHGSPAVEVSTHTYGIVVVTNALQWAAVQDLVAREMLSGEGEGEGEESVEMHVEVVILWFEVDTMHRLHYEDVSGVSQPAGGEDSGSGGVLSAARPATAESNASRGTVTNHYKTVNNHNNTYNYYGAPESGGSPNNNNNNSNSKEARTVTLLLVDIAGEHIGEVVVELERPTLTRPELLKRVRAATEVARGDECRLAYRVLPPQALLTGRSEDGRRGSQLSDVLAEAPLKPLETDDDVDGMVRDVLLYGYRAMRIVVADAADDSHGGERELEPHRPAQPRTLRADSTRDPRLRSDSTQDPRLRSDSLQDPRLRSDSMQDPKPQQLYPTEEEEGETEAPPLQPLRHEDYEDPRLRHFDYEDPRLRAMDAQDPRLRHFDYEDPRLRSGSVQEPKPQQLYPTEDPAPAEEEKASDKDDGGVEEEEDEEEEEGEGGPRKSSIVQQLVVVRCDLDPTEILLSGIVREAALDQLGDQIFIQVCKRGRAKTDPTAFTTEEEEWERRPRFEKLLDDKRSPDANGAEYILRLHEYNFTEDQEEELARCIDEAMQELEGYEPIASNKIEEGEEDEEEEDEEREL